MEAASSPISDPQRQDLQQRLVDNFHALLFHREVSAARLAAAPCSLVPAWQHGHACCIARRQGTTHCRPAACLLLSEHWTRRLQCCGVPQQHPCPACASLQGYRPSHVPQELIEQIAVVVEAKAFLHVVSTCGVLAATGQPTALSELYPGMGLAQRCCSSRHLQRVARCALYSTRPALRRCAPLSWA